MSINHYNEMDMTEPDFTKIKWPATLTDNLKNKLLHFAQVGHSTKNLPVSYLNFDFPGVYYIISGQLLVSFGTHDMNNFHSCVFGENDWLGMVTLRPMFEGFVYHIQELQDIEYLYFPKSKVLALAEIDSEVYKWLYFSLSRTAPKRNQNQIISLGDLRSRVIYSLLDLLKYQPNRAGIHPCLYHSQEQLAAITAISRPRLNEILKALEKEKKVSIARGQLHLLDIKALERELDSINLMFYDPRKMF